MSASESQAAPPPPPQPQPPSESQAPSRPPSALPFFLHNAFVLPETAHSGNQAAVVLLPPESKSDPRTADDRYKAKVARDFNFAETAYVQPLEDGKYSLRWWTPAVEVALCGHATLAAAATLFALHPEQDHIEFQTRWSGILTARRRSDLVNHGMDIQITLPTLTAEALSSMLDDDSSEATDAIAPIFLDATSGIGMEEVVNVVRFVWGARESAIIELAPGVDLAKLRVRPKDLLPITTGMIIVTQMNPHESSERLHINSRVFGPGVGIDEDPVTGSAHAYLTAYYLSTPVALRLPSRVLAGKSSTGVTIEARQLSPRGGAMVCTLDHHGKARLVGRSVEMGKGELSVFE